MAQQDAGGCFGAALGLVLLAAAAIVGGLLVSGHGVLYAEKTSTLLPGFTCSYFTGTRTVELYTFSQTGCQRFITIGDVPPS